MIKRTACFERRSIRWHSMRDFFVFLDRADKEDREYLPNVQAVRARLDQLAQDLDFNSMCRLQCYSSSRLRLWLYNKHYGDLFEGSSWFSHSKIDQDANAYASSEVKRVTEFIEELLVLE